jgi:hypothetical protein
MMVVMVLFFNKLKQQQKLYDIYYFFAEESRNEVHDTDVLKNLYELRKLKSEI